LSSAITSAGTAKTTATVPRHASIFVVLMDLILLFRAISTVERYQYSFDAPIAD
jgi:hypothetical protein